MPTVPGVSRSVSGVPAFIDPRAGRAEFAPQMNGARSRPRYYWDSSDPRGKADYDQNTWKICRSIDDKKLQF